MMARKRQRSSSDGGKKKQLMELPVDTLVDILLRLPAKSVGRIRCVSKAFLNMVNNISFSTLHTRSLPIATNSAAAADQVPRLMCCSRDDPLVTLQSLEYKDNALTKGRYAITISSSTPCFLRFVFCNVFCLGNKNGDCMLVNGLGERGVLRLPEANFARIENGPDVYRNSRFGMGFDDKTNTYKIVCVTHERDADYLRQSMTAHVLVLGTNSWRQIFSLPPYELSWIHKEPVCANGVVHWWTGSEVCDDRRIVSFDLRREEFSWNSIPPTLQSSNKLYWDSDVSCLFTLRGSLAIVEKKCRRSASGVMIWTMEIWVLKDYDENQWVRYYYNNNILENFPLQSPGEWEHGIFFTSHGVGQETCVFFIDLRSGSINRLIYSAYKIVYYEDNYTGYCATLVILKHNQGC